MTPFGYACFDLDGTLISKNSSFLFCRYLARKGVFSRLDLVYAVCLYMAHVCGFISLHKLHTKVFARLFQGKKVADLEAYLAPFIAEKILPIWYEPALSRLKEIQKHIPVAIYSSSPNFIVRAIGKEIGVDQIVASEYLVDKEMRLCGIAKIVEENSGVLEGEEFKALARWSFYSAHNWRYGGFYLYPSPFKCSRYFLRSA